MSIFSKVSTQDKSHFTNNLSVMLQSGIPIDQALTTLADQSSSKQLQKAVMNVSSTVKKGTLLSAAFAAEKKTFGSIFVSLIKAGEESGTLRESLVFLAEWFERSADLKREVDGATLYPKLVLSASILLGGSLAVFILPRLVPLFSQLDVELPFITKVLLSSALFIQTQWIWLIVGVVGFVILLRFLMRFYILRRLFDTAQISIPFIGPILREYQLALVTQLLATLLRSGLPITRAIVIVEEATPNIRFQESIVSMQETVSSGKALSTAMEQYPKLYPKMCVSITAVGEQSGTLSDSFTYLNEHYTKEVKAKAKKLPTIIEPILLIFIAAVVGMVALAIILPIYKLTGSIT